MGKVFNVSAFFIVLREVLEACLVVGIVLAYLSKTGATQLKKFVWIGTACGVGLAFVVGLAFCIVYYTRGDQLFEGKAEYIFEGIIFLVAAALLTWMVLWMLRLGKTLKTRFESNVDTALESESGGKWGILTMVFVQVLREGIELIIFLFGASEASEGKDKWKSIILPSILGLIVGLAVAYVVFKGLVTLDIGKFFFISSLVLIAFAAGLFSHAFHELQEAGWFGGFVDVDPKERAWYNAPMWSTESCCNDKENEFFAILRALFGYQDKPTFLEWITYFAYWFIVLAILIVFNWASVRVARNKTMRLARLWSSVALLCFFIAFIYAVSNATWTGILTTSLGLIISVVAVAVLFESVVGRISALRAARRSLGFITAAALFALTILLIVLHIVQMSCLEKSCRMPEFYYWGLIFQSDWLKRGNIGTSFVSVAVLSVSLVICIFFFGALALLMYLFATHVSSDGQYVYEDRVKVSGTDSAEEHDLSDRSRAGEPLAV